MSTSAVAAEDFPHQVRELLAEAKRQGLGFDLAWREAIAAVRPADPSWSQVMPFLRRAMREAYEGRGQDLAAYAAALEQRRPEL